MGPKTRKELIFDYMALDGATAKPADIQITCHGCGEHFPLDEGKEEIDPEPKDAESDAVDRRVELFFFKKNPGILPPPPGKNSSKGSTEYATWRARAKRLATLNAGEGGAEALVSTVPLEQLAGAAKLMDAGHFIAWLTSLFGHDIPEEAYRKLREGLVSNSFTMPPLELVDTLPDEHVAAYNRESKKILIVRSLVRAAETDENRAALLLTALIEEFGHHIDNTLRTGLSNVGGDAKLDEGARFGYAICNLGWDIRDEAVIGTFARDGDKATLRVRWPVFKKATERVFSPEEQRSDDMKDALEFFGAGRGHGKPGQSFGHESVEDVLSRFGRVERQEIYFGNWLRDYSQAITPFTLKLFSLAGGFADAALPGTSATSRFQTDPRGVITEILDLYARAKFDDIPQFRVTRARLGLYRSEEHIDNPTGLKTSTRDPAFDLAPTDTQLKIDPVTQRANYIGTKLTRPAKSAVEYMREELSAAISAGPTAEGRRRFGQALHTLEDFYAHSNFCELALRSVGQTTVEPWTVPVTLEGKTFFPLVTGCFGGIDTAASIFLAIGEILEAEKDHQCEAGKRTLGVKIALIFLRDLRPHLAKQADAALTDFAAFQEAHPLIATLVCRTLGTLIRFIHWMVGVVVRLLANQIDEYQSQISGPSLNPTHTQLAKDHDDHVLHVLAANCARIAVRDIGELMFAAWKPPSAMRDNAVARILDKAESYFVHPDLILPGPVGSRELIQVLQQVRTFADDPANAAAIARASQRTVLDSHLKEIEEFGSRATKAIPIERLKQMFRL